MLLEPTRPLVGEPSGSLLPPQARWTPDLYTPGPAACRLPSLPARRGGRA